MEDIINKYKDKNNYIKELYKLYKELIKLGIDKDIVLEEINKIYLNNINIKSKLLDFYKKELELQKNILINKSYIDYKVDSVINRDNNSIISNNNFYDSFIIDSISDGNYLDILPKEYSKDSITVFAKVFNYYLITIQFYKSLLAVETNEEDIILLNKELSILYKTFNNILEYKDKLKNKDKSIDVKENKLVFFMYDSEPYIYYDILDNPTIYSSIKKLLNSIRLGTFKNISKFTDYKNLLEVRDLSNQTRVIFERRNNLYVIIGAITNKSETNKLYRERLNNRFKLYQNNISNIDELSNSSSLRKILCGDINE